MLDTPLRWNNCCGAAGLWATACFVPVLCRGTGSSVRQALPSRRQQASHQRIPRLGRPAAKPQLPAQPQLPLRSWPRRRAFLWLVCQKPQEWAGYYHPEHQRGHRILLLGKGRLSCAGGFGAPFVPRTRWGNDEDASAGLPCVAGSGGAPRSFSRLVSPGRLTFPVRFARF